MEEPEIIHMTNLAGGALCITPQDGQKVFEAIREVLQAGKHAVISFSGVEDLTTPFLHTAIGQLYGIFSENELKERLSVQDASPPELAMFKRTIERAKEYFRDPKHFEAAAMQEFGEDDEQD